MDYQTALEGFLNQFDTKYQIANQEKLRPFKLVILVGMGGSRLAPDLLHMLHPEMGIHVHSDYVLPAMSQETLADALIVANSHSGNTAETISAAEAALAKGLNLAVVTSGGKLAEFAQEHQLPNIITNDTNLMPRVAFGFDFAALSQFLKIEIPEIQDKETIASRSQLRGQKMAEMFDAKVALIFAPQAWMPLAYIWKIALNETAKVPAFCNRLPEMNHNEIAGYNPENHLCGPFSALMIRDSKDERMSKRIGITADLLRRAEIPVEIIDLPVGEPLAQAAEMALSAHWTAYELAKRRGVDPATVPVIEQLKTAMH